MPAIVGSIPRASTILVLRTIMIMKPEHIEYQIRNKLAEDPRICDLIEDDDDFDHLISLIGNTIDDWLNPIQLFLDKSLK